MFYSLNTRSKYLLFLAIALLVPYLFRSSYLWDSYYEEYYEGNNTAGLNTISFILIFASLIARSEYVHRSLLALSGIWAIANLVPRRFDDWFYGSFMELFTILLYIGGLVALSFVLVAEKAFINFQIGSYFSRIGNSQHKIFTIIWAVLTVIAALFSSWASLLSSGEITLNSVVKVLAVFISVVAIFDFIHRFFEEKSHAILGVVRQLNDFSLNSYLTRRISSWIYGLLHTVILLGTLYAVPVFMSSTFPTWILIFAFPVVAPLAIVVAYLFIMIIRLIFEYSNALVHVAENTYKR
ncbi:MAG: DUF4282 domain-containing protein [Candidatus Planktophila sp.]